MEKSSNTESIEIKLTWRTIPEIINKLLKSRVFFLPNLTPLIPPRMEPIAPPNAQSACVIENAGKRIFKLSDTEIDGSASGDSDIVDIVVLMTLCW